MMTFAIIVYLMFGIGFSSDDDPLWLCALVAVTWPYWLGFLSASR
jgi:hypothetical protein